MWKTISSGKKWTGELTNKKKNGDAIIERTIIAPIFDQQNHIINYVAVKEDITQQKQALERLKASEEKFRTLVQNTADGLVVFNNNEQIEYVSPSYLKLLGYTEETELGRSTQHILQLIHPDDKHVVAKIRQAIADKKQYFSYDYRVRNAAGQYIWRQDHATFVYDKNGNYQKSYVVCSDITSQKLAETALRESEKRYRMVVENVGEGVCIVDDKDYFLYSNSKAEEIFGLEKGQLIGKNVLEFVKPDKHDFIRQQTLERKRGIANSYEIEIVRPNGEVRVLLISLQPYFNHKNEFQYIYGIFRDVTLRKQTQKKLETSEAKLKAMLHTSNDGFVLLNQQGQQFFVNEAVKNITGFSADEVTGDFARWIHPDDLPTVLEAFASIVKTTNQKTTVQYRHKHKTNGWVWLEAIAQNYLTNPALNAVVVNVRDITRLKADQIRLKSSEEKFRTLFEESMHPLWLVNKQGQIVQFNKAAHQLLEYSKEEFGQLQIHQIDILNSEVYVQKIVNQIFEHGKLTFETQHITRTKRILHIAVNAVVVNLNGQHLMLTAFYDLTPIKQAENQIREYSRKLEAANAAKDKFFSIIAHDLKSPFNSILGFSDLLIKNIDHYDKAKIKQQLSRIHKTSYQTFSLLENLLTWSRSQNGRIKFRPQVLNVQQMIHELLQLFENKAYEKNIGLVTDFSGVSHVEADPDMLKTILRNLVSNALKFTPARGVVSILVSSDNKKNVQFEVIDTGVGMSDEAMANVFRTDNKTATLGTNDEKGTGLGLLLVKEFVDRHGGQIKLKSELNGGTTVSFTIPLQPHQPPTNTTD